MKKVLVLAPHTDDGELGCGGTVARLLEEGCEVHFAVFSTCAESVPAGFPADELKTEFLSAMEGYGIPAEQLILFDFQVRHFPAHRQEILEELVRLNRRIVPDLVLPRRCTMCIRITTPSPRRPSGPSSARASSATRSRGTT